MKYPNFADARCREIGIELFFEDDETGKFVDVRKSKGLCSGCPIVSTCLEWALHHEKYGIWGGTTPKERDEMRKKMNIIMTEPSYEARLRRRPNGMAK
jgi:WhiB family redox-sensing transcriptional regulator